MVKKYCPLFIFLQETWLSDHESCNISNDFQEYCFLTTSSDMFIPVEDLLLKSGPVWHGTAIGWKKSIDKDITKLPIISERFCGVKYVDKSTDISIILYTIYLPTSGQDEEFLEIISSLSFDNLTFISHIRKIFTKDISWRLLVNTCID